MTPEQISDAMTTNLEIAMRALARAGALSDELWGIARMAERTEDELCAAHDSGAFWFQSRALSNELGREMPAVAASARHYANGVICGALNVV